MVIVRDTLGECFVLFCFVWLATLGLPVLASRTAARAFPTRNKSAVIGAPAPRWLREEPLAPKCPPTLNEVRCPGIADPVIHGQLRRGYPSHVSRVSGPLNATRSP